MLKSKKVVVVMPALNAERTIEKTWREVLDQEIVDLVVDPVDLAAQRVQGASGGGHRFKLPRKRGRIVVVADAREIKENVDIAAPCFLPMHALPNNS